MMPASDTLASRCPAADTLVADLQQRQLVRHYPPELGPGLDDLVARLLRAPRHAPDPLTAYWLVPLILSCVLIGGVIVGM